MFGRRNNKRRTYLIDREVQLPFIGILVFIALLTCVQLLGYLFFLDPNALQRDAAKYGLDSDPLTLSFIIVQQKEMLLWLFLLLAVNGILMAIFGLYYSHRIAGPMYNIRMFFNRVADGDLNRKVRLRKTDYFQGVAIAINRAMDTVRERLGITLEEEKPAPSEEELQAIAKNEETVEVERNEP